MSLIITCRTCGKAMQFDHDELAFYCRNEDCPNPGRMKGFIYEEDSDGNVTLSAGEEDAAGDNASIKVDD